MKITLSEIFNNSSIYVHGNNKYFFKTASIDYADEIYDCYVGVNVNESNITEKLNMNSSEYFGRCGGIFSIPSRLDIGSLISEGEDAFIVSENKEAGKINAMLHLSVKDSELYNNINFGEDISSYIIDEIKECGLNGRIVYPLEYVSVNELHGGGIVYPMLKYVYSKLKEFGFKFALVEIYTIIGYEDATENRIYLNCSNDKSVKINRKIGGINVGCLNNRVCYLNNKSIYIRPDIYAVELEKAVSLLI